MLKRQRRRDRGEKTQWKRHRGATEGKRQRGRDRGVSQRERDRGRDRAEETERKRQRGRDRGEETERSDGGKGEVSLRATWGQGGQDRTTLKEGFQVSNRNRRGTDKETGKGNKKGGCAITLYCHSMYMYIINRVNAINNLMCLGCK
jgi:hypothetical protein